MALPEPSAPTPFDDGELYDILLGDLDYGVEFYTGLAKRAAGPVLDIGCGTGRVMLPCLQSGLDIDGLDMSEPMLARLRGSAAKLDLSPRLYHADMSDFRLPRQYALIMIPFNSFTHNLTQETQIRCLERCREHLLRGGMLVFDGAFPGLHWIGAQASRPDPIRAMAEAQVGSPGRLGAKLTRNPFMVAQVALAGVISIGALLFLRTIRQLQSDLRYV